MTKLKMGIHNQIDAERFHLIRGAMADGMPDEQLMKKYEIKQTTLRYIRKSKTYYEYRLYTEALPAARKMGKVIAPSSGLAFEDYSPRKKRTLERENCKLKTENSNLKLSLTIWIAVATICAIIIGVMGAMAVINKIERSTWLELEQAE